MVVCDLAFTQQRRQITRGITNTGEVNPPASRLYFSQETCEKQNARQKERTRMQVQIRVQERLDPSWQEWFEGLQITHESDGMSLLSGVLQDQAALYGVLWKLRHLSVTLLSLETSPLP